MSLVLKEVRVPTPSRRARKILGALSGGGPIVDFTDSGAIDPEIVGVAMLYPQPLVPTLAMTLAAGTWVGQTLHIVLASQDEASWGATVTVPGPPAYAAPVGTGAETVATFSQIDQFLTLIWDGTNWAVRATNPAPDAVALA